MNYGLLKFCKRALEVDAAELGSARTRARPAELGVLDVCSKFAQADFAPPSALERGHAIVDGIRKSLRVIDVRSKKARYPAQVEVTEMYISAMAHLFYGAEYYNNLFVIMQRNKWTPQDMHWFCTIQAPRQVGKSTITSRVAASVLMNAPNIYGFAVATDLNQAAIILREVKHLIKSYFPTVKIKINNSRELALEFSPGDVRRMEVCAYEQRVRFTSLAALCRLRLSLLLSSASRRWLSRSDTSKSIL